MGKKRAREEGKEVPPADVDKMVEDSSDDEVGNVC
jgi:protein BCP1